MCSLLRRQAGTRAFVTAQVLMANRTRFVLVEGESDFGFLTPHLGGRARVAPVDGGREEVQKAHQDLGGKGANNFVALIDADFNEVVGLNPRMERLVYVSISSDPMESTIDLEATLIRTRALRQVCGEILGNRIQDYGGPKAFTDEMREALRLAAAAVGAYRAAVMSFFAEKKSIQGIGEVSDAEWESFVDLESGALDPGQLERFVGTRVRNAMKFPLIKAMAADCLRNAGHGWLLCRGHDMTQLLALRLSAITRRPLDRRSVERQLLSSFKGNLLKDTAFGRELNAFCT